MKQVALFTLVWLASAGALAQGIPGKKALDHDAYDVWRNISGQKISNDGQWVLYTLSTQDGDPTVVVVNTDTQATHTVEDGTSGAFTADSAFVVCTLNVKKEVTRQAKRDKAKKDEMPKDGLALLNLSSGEIERIDRVKNFKIPEEGDPWVAYLMEKPPEEDGKDESDDEEEAAENSSKEDDTKKKEDGTELVLRRLDTESEARFEFVSEYVFSKNGGLFAFATSSKDGEHDGARAVLLDSVKTVALLSGVGDYKQVAASDDGLRAAFLSNREDYDANQPEYRLYAWEQNDVAAHIAASSRNPAIEEGWWISEHGKLRFSEQGARLYFGTAPKPEPDPEEEPLEDEQVKVDVWNWRDPFLQPMQLVNLEDEQKRTYLAVADLDDGRITQLATESVPELNTVMKGEAGIALGISDIPYRKSMSWDWPGYQDVFTVDIETGEKNLVVERLQGNAILSPDARYVYWWDRHELAWIAQDIGTGNRVVVTKGISVPLQDELHDRPMTPNAYGHRGWTENDEFVLVYDKYDVWACDPTGQRPPRNVTQGVGRQNGLRFRIVDLDPDEAAFSTTSPLLLSAFDYATKESGFYRLTLDLDEGPEKLIMDARIFGGPQKAKYADTLLYTRESFEEFPDLWVNASGFESASKLSDANPQQDEYRWGTSEIVTWTSSSGEDLDGILFKPDDFETDRAYPLMVYFYERLSNQLHQHHAPQAVRASINISLYVSRGYLVFIPDIPYRKGYPGESALQAVIPGVLDLIGRGFVDRERIGVQGHSWGGYQIAYLITRTGLFAAAEAGAPVSNMTSAYGGIRWQTGMSRMFQYEKTQSRIGGSLWERPLQYIENSPLFWADKIETPLLILHNDKDGAVPWYQGIEMFVAMRRLGKPVWLLNYNDEGHGLSKFINKRDWAIRMQQFFDHFLLDAPAPVWLREGVPAIKKGKTLGLEMVNSE